MAVRIDSGVPACVLDRGSSGGCRRPTWRKLPGEVDAPQKLLAAMAPCDAAVTREAREVLEVVVPLLKRVAELIGTDVVWIEMATWLPDDVLPRFGVLGLRRTDRDTR